MIVEVVRVGHCTDIPSIDWSTCICGVGCPRTGILPMRSCQLHALIISVNWSWLSSIFLESLCLIFQSLSVLLVSMNKLYFLLGPFISWGLGWWLLVLEGYLFLGDTMSIRGLKWWWDSIHGELHKVLLTRAWIGICILKGVSVSIFGRWWVLWRSDAVAEVNLRRLLNYSTSWFGHSISDIKRLNSSIMILNLLLETSLSLMALWSSNNVARSSVHVSFSRADISLSKLVLNNGHLSILGWVWHGSASDSWTKLLADVQSILNYWPSVGFLVTDHSVWLRSIWSLSVCISAFSNILKLSLVISIWEVIMINGSVRFSILAVPFVLRSSHYIALTDCLRLPFLCHRLLLPLNVSWRKLNGVLVSWLPWNTDCLHLSSGVWIQSCRCIFHVLLLIAVLIIHRYNY